MMMAQPAYNTSGPRRNNATTRDTQIQVVTSSIMQPVLIDLPRFSGDPIVRASLTKTHMAIQALLAWPENWNGYAAAAPDPRAVARASDWILQFFWVIGDTGHAWTPPNVTASADGEVVIEWRNDTKKLAIYIDANSVEYVKVWGADVATEMADGEANSVADYRALWLWLQR